MSAFRQKAEAQKRFTELTTKLGFRPNVNLRHMNAKQINAINDDLAKQPKINTISPKKFNKSRSSMISQIKKINPAFKSSKSDTFYDLSRKYRQQLPKLPFVGQINNSDLIHFLKNPIDEASIKTTAQNFIKSIDSMNTTNSFYLLLSVDTTMIDNESDDKPSMTTEYKVISNVDEIKKLLKVINKDGFELNEQTIGHGSDTELVYSLLKTYNKTITLTWYAVDTYRKVHSGAFFKYFNTTKLDLTRYQVFKETDNSDDADKFNCLIYALMMSEKVQKVALDDLKLSMFHKEVKARDIKTIAKKLDITIKLRYDAKQSESVFNKGCKDFVSIGLVDNHYFINELTNITKLALDKYEDVKSDVDFPMIHRQKTQPMKPLTSYQVINSLFTKYNKTMLKPITLNNVANKQSVDKLIDYEELRAPAVKCGCELSDFVYCHKNDDDDVECDHYFCRLKDLLENCCCEVKDKNHEFRDYGYLSAKRPFRGFFKNPKTDPNENYEMWFVDSETSIHEKLQYHTAKTLCAIRYNESSDSFQEFEFFGLDCIEQFLNQLTSHSIIYAHNMAFDFRVFVDHLYDLETPIESGTKLKQIQGKFQRGFYKNKKGITKKSFIHLLFKDSYSFLPEKLSALPKMLNLPTGDKEVYPYTLINDHNFDKCIPLSECRKHIKKGLRKAFAVNAKKIGCLSDDLMVDMKKYTIHYCMQDTRILAHAFIKFRKQILEVCKLDIVPRISLPQLADDFLKSKNVYDDCFSISGIAENFISRCCVGGRVMTNSNQKYHIKQDCNKKNQVETTTIRSTVGRGQGCFNEKVMKVKVCDNYSIINDTKILHNQPTYTKKEIRLLRDAMNAGAVVDFDAVSLYPSAFSMLKGYVKGLPKVLSSDDISNFNSVKDSFDAYYVEIEVISHTIDREFPLLSIKNKSGIRDFTNDIDGQRFFVDNIALEDLIEFQGVECKVIRGYYYNDGFNTKITETIKFMFNERKRLKKECICGQDCKAKKCGGNNLQIVYKLLMNSAYGKCIQKAITSGKKFVEVDQLRKYVAKNHKFIDSYERVNDHLYVVRENKSSITHFKACHIAANILSMSKRLMNRVMCLAEDIGIKIYYQDTDSMHLHERAIPKLSEAFEEKYKTKLIGSDMCQFHTDFSVSDGGATNIRAVESIFLGKKCYIDKLKYTNQFLNDKYDYHIRAKGVPTQSIRDYDSDYMRTYLRLLNGEMLEFDLRPYCPLQIDRDYRARANTKCVSRKLQY